MLRAVLPMVAVLSLVPLLHPGQAATITALKSPKVDVPTSDAMFPAGAGSDQINNNCLACHSADHVLNQPSLSREAWQEVVNKMITAYKAPVSAPPRRPRSDAQKAASSGAPPCLPRPR